MDSSSYIPSQSEEIIITNPADANLPDSDTSTTWGPTLFDVMNGMADKVGEMIFVITLSMQVSGNWTNDIMVAEAAETKLGSRLDSMLLGNVSSLISVSGEFDIYG